MVVRVIRMLYIQIAFNSAKEKLEEKQNTQQNRFQFFPSRSFLVFFTYVRLHVQSTHTHTLIHSKNTLSRQMKKEMARTEPNREKVLYIYMCAQEGGGECQCIQRWRANETKRKYFIGNHLHTCKVCRHAFTYYSTLYTNHT